ncbi:transient receptor potential cation channel subfamily M member-like 2 isoform X1 [Crassostrea angulata]|uniref:transient receptor potential cation channel subfamily M member-like 2 isoform X1 n=1 Tax=Magallana angulata TaxID=2784310 RepID=UPI0022B085D8|nr:transient receptor potential cation channel subfamily M member-like 2 isoform X1 [Crassostrea angulata]
MDSKEANVESASAYSGVIPGRSLNQPQHELIGSPRRREAREEEEKKEEEEESHGNQKNADKEPTQVKRKPKFQHKLQPIHDLIELEREKEPFQGDGKTKKAKRKKRKMDKEKSRDGSGSFTVSDPLSRSSEGYSKKGKTSEVNDSTGTYTNQRITNKSLSNADPAVELALVKSNGTYTQNDDDKDCVGETRQNRKEPMGLSKKITARRINETSFRNFVTKSKIMIRIPLKEDELENAHTKQELSDSFGIIDNTGFAENDALTRYLRCVPDTKADIIWAMLIDQWHLKRPQLIISVTGDAQRFDLKRTMQEKLNLMNAPTSSCTWIITGGTQSGVWELMGDAVKDHNSSWERKNDVVVLGVAPWGCVANRQALEEEEKRNPNDNTNVPQGKIHTHFILIDDGSENKFGGEIEFRSRLEKFISEQRVDPHDKDSSRTIPAISIIVGGDINTMKVMWQSVMNRIPVLVLQSSGGVADFIALGYKITTNLYNKEESFFPLTFDEDLKDLVDIIFAWKAEDLPKKQKLVESCLKQLREALQHRELLTVFDLNDNETEEIDRAILYALLKATRSNTNTQLSLALAWNMPDIAKNEIFTASNKTNYQKLDLHDAMMSAFIQDRLEFVKLFLENGIDLSQFLDIHNLWKLFVNCFNDKNDASAQLLRNLMDRPVLVRMKKMKNEPLDISEYLYCIGQVIADLLCNNAMSFVYNPRLLAVNPTKNLFIWAILMNRMSLAIHLWRIGNDHVGTALFASCLLKKLSKEAYEEDELELSTTLKKHSLEFEKLASEVLGICYLKSRYLSHQLLVRELKEFGNTTLFCMAEENILMDFLAQTCCQTKLSAIWKKHMALSTSRKKIVATILMPLCIFAIIFVDKKALRDKLDDLDPLNLTEKNCMPEQQDVAVCKDRHVKIRGLNGKVAPFPGFKSKDEQHWCDSNWCYDNFRSFYTAPVTKFITAMFANIVFLGLFSFFVLTDLHPIGENGAPSLVEIFSWIYTITSLIDEVYQVKTRNHGSICHKIGSWFRNAWNRFDIVLYLFFLTSVILRFSLYGEDFVWARRLYSLTLGMYFFRFLQYFEADKNIGPKVTMISRMLNDLKFFLLILLVFILSFGVTYQANLYPNAPQEWSVLQDVLYHPYWQMYGELFLENKEGKDPSEDLGTCTKNETLWRSGEKERCPEKSFLVVLLMAVFLLLTNVLLLNLLIAMFSDTVKKVHENSEKEWRFHRFSLVYEYYNRPFLFPPLNILDYFVKLYSGAVTTTKAPATTKKTPALERS